MSSVEVICQSCGKSFQRPIQRGRPAVRCEKCRNAANPTVREVMTSLKPSQQQEKVSEQIQEITAITKEKYDATVAHLYRVMVGNLGLAFAGDDEKEAKSNFTSYSKKSQQGFGQVGFERVQLWKLNAAHSQYEVVEDFIPDRST